MSLPELPHKPTELQMRKAVVQMRLELHRQELRHHSLLALQPLQDARKVSQLWQSTLGISFTPLLGATTLGLLAAVLTRAPQLNLWLKLGSAIVPLIAQLIRRAASDKDQDQHQSAAKYPDKPTS
jgi:hypothetical protein